MPASKYYKHFIQYLKYIPNYLLQEIQSFPQIAYVIELRVLAYYVTAYLLVHLLAYLEIYDSSLIIIKYLLIFKLAQLLGGLFISRYCKYLYNLANISASQYKKLMYKAASKLNHIDSIKKLAIIYHLKGKLPKVINLYEQRARGGCMDSLKELSKLYLQNKVQPTNIIRICKILKLYKHDPKINNMVDYHLGIIYGSQKYYGHNIVRSDKYLNRSNKDNETIAELCGDFYFEQHNFVKAEMMYKRSIKLGSINAHAKMMILYDSPLNNSKSIDQRISIYWNIIKNLEDNPNAVITLVAAVKLRNLMTSKMEYELGAF